MKCEGNKLDMERNQCMIPLHIPVQPLVGKCIGLRIRVHNFTEKGVIFLQTSACPRNRVFQI